jgi:hypothetical protein
MAPLCGRGAERHRKDNTVNTTTRDITRTIEALERELSEINVTLLTLEMQPRIRTILSDCADTISLDIYRLRKASDPVRAANPLRVTAETVHGKGLAAQRTGCGNAQEELDTHDQPLT